MPVTPGTSSLSTKALYLKPRSLDEAVALLAAGPAQILSGGTDFYPRLGDRVEPLLDKHGVAQALRFRRPRWTASRAPESSDTSWSGTFVAYNLAEIRASLAARTPPPAPVPATPNTEVRLLSRRRRAL